MQLPIYNFERITICQSCDNYMPTHRCKLNNRSLGSFTNTMVNSCPIGKWKEILTDEAKKQAFEIVKFLEEAAFQMHIIEVALNSDLEQDERIRDNITEENAWELVRDNTFITYGQNIEYIIDSVIIPVNVVLPEKVLQIAPGRLLVNGTAIKGPPCPCSKK